MDTVTIVILLFWTSNRYNYLTLRNLLSVLVYNLISLNFGIKTGQCQSYGQLSVVTSYHTRTRSLLETLLTWLGYFFCFLSCQWLNSGRCCWWLFHPACSLCFVFIVALGDADRCAKGLPSHTIHISHFSLPNQLLHNNSSRDA